MANAHAVDPHAPTAAMVELQAPQAPTRMRGLMAPIEAVSAALLVALVSLVLVSVFWRYVLGSPITAADVAVAAPEAEAELAVGFFGSRYERATPAEREYMRTMAALSADLGSGPDAEVDAAVLTNVAIMDVRWSMASESPLHMGACCWMTDGGR